VHAARELGITPDQGIAVEDCVNGALSAVAAGHPTVGTVQFVPPDQRAERTQALTDVGAAAVVTSWEELAELLA
jgi:beta-phosphoglucomutase-like phosphatase (HAD superfamily)